MPIVKKAGKEYSKTTLELDNELKQRVIQLYTTHFPHAKTYEWKRWANASLKAFVDVLESGYLPPSKWEEWFKYYNLLQCKIYKELIALIEKKQKRKTR